MAAGCTACSKARPMTNTERSWLSFLSPEGNVMAFVIGGKKKKKDGVRTLESPQHFSGAHVCFCGIYLSSAIIKNPATGDWKIEVCSRRPLDHFLAAQTPKVNTQKLY